MDFHFQDVNSTIFGMERGRNEERTRRDEKTV